MWPVIWSIYCIIILFSLAATIYTTFVIQDYEIFGVFTEFEEGISYTEFYYNGDYYEVETKSYLVDDVLTSIADTLNISEDELSDNMYYALEYAIEEATLQLLKTELPEKDSTLQNDYFETNEKEFIEVSSSVDSRDILVAPNNNEN